MIPMCCIEENDDRDLREDEGEPLRAIDVGAL
jgi:hypothetical protein